MNRPNKIFRWWRHIFDIIYIIIFIIRCLASYFKVNNIIIDIVDRCFIFEFYIGSFNNISLIELFFFLIRILIALFLAPSILLFSFPYLLYFLFKLVAWVNKCNRIFRWWKHIFDINYIIILIIRCFAKVNIITISWCIKIF